MPLPRYSIRWMLRSSSSIRKKAKNKNETRSISAPQASSQSVRFRSDDGDNDHSNSARYSCKSHVVWMGNGNLTLGFYIWSAISTWLALLVWIVIVCVLYVCGVAAILSSLMSSPLCLPNSTVVWTLRWWSLSDTHPPKHDMSCWPSPRLAIASN